MAQERLRRFVLGPSAVVTVGFIGLFVSQCNVALAEDSEVIPSLRHYQLYADVGYASSDNTPGNHEWRSKSTTSTLDSFEFFLGMGSVRKDATEDSRWGLELGLQTGRDSEGLVTAPPPPALEPVEKAESWRHLYRANVSYFFNAGSGLRLTGDNIPRNKGGHP